MATMTIFLKIDLMLNSKFSFYSRKIKSKNYTSRIVQDRAKKIAKLNIKKKYANSG